MSNLRSKFNEVQRKCNPASGIFIVYSGVNTIIVSNNKTGASTTERQFILSTLEFGGFIFLNMFYISQN